MHEFLSFFLAHWLSFALVLGSFVAIWWVYKNYDQLKI